MGAIKNILIGFISIFLILSVSLLIFFGALNSLLHPQIYESALKENNFYDTIDLSKIQGGEFIKLPNGVEFLVNGLLENFLSYMRGETEEPNLRIQIDTENLRNFFKERLNEIPECSGNETAYDESGNPKCKPSGKTTDEFLDEFLKNKNVTVFEQDSVDLSNVYNLQSEEVSRIRGFVKIFRFAFFGLMFFSAFLIVLIFVLSLDSIHSGIMTTGIDFFIAGISVLPAGFLIPKILTEKLGSVGLPIVADVAENVAVSLVSRMNFYAYVSIGIGAVLFALSFVFRKIGK